MSRVNFIGHKGKHILFIDFSKASTEEVLAIIKEAKLLIALQPLNSLLTLTDVTEGAYNPRTSPEMREYIAHNKPYVKAAAVIGVKGLKKVIFDTIVLLTKRRMALFDNAEDAKDWLIKQ